MKQEKQYYVNIMTNQYNTVLYTGVTGDIHRRIQEHKMKADPKSFTSRYNIDKLVYAESFENILDAIRREKQIKAGSRAKKIALIESVNKDWHDLSSEI